MKIPNKKAPQSKQQSPVIMAGATSHVNPKISTSHAKIMAIAKGPKKAEAFLIEAGIITEAGKLAPENAA